MRTALALINGVVWHVLNIAGFNPQFRLLADTKVTVGLFFAIYLFSSGAAYVASGQNPLFLQKLIIDLLFVHLFFRKKDSSNVLYATLFCVLAITLILRLSFFYWLGLTDIMDLPVAANFFLLFYQASMAVVAIVKFKALPDECRVKGYLPKKTSD